jgi:hypothetical protein
VLGPLFQRWKGGWFTQRQTVSLGLETALSQVTLGSVHVIRGQGLNEPAFCDAHTDELDAGSILPSSPLSIFLFVSSNVLTENRSTGQDRDAVAEQGQRAGQVPLDGAGLL